MTSADILTSKKKRTKRCHGNRKLRLFRKKCRRRGMTEEKITESIQNYHRTNERNQTVNMEINTTTETRYPRSKSQKRKRMTTSASSRSISIRSPKRSKNKIDNIVDDTTTNRPKYRLPKYLTKASNLLYQALRLQMKLQLNKKTQQQFLYRRLQLFDQQYRLDLHRNLWQSYRQLGSIEQLWPVSI